MVDFVELECSCFFFLGFAVFGFVISDLANAISEFDVGFDLLLQFLLIVYVVDVLVIHFEGYEFVFLPNLIHIFLAEPPIAAGGELVLVLMESFH